MRRWAALAVLGAALGCSSAILADDMSTMDMGSGSKADTAFAATMQTMMKTMVMTGTGRPDIDFATMMVPHHQGAIDMAKVELQYGTDPDLRELAAGIVAAQEKEIATLKDWLARHRT